MTTSRRNFLKLSLSAASLLALDRSALAASGDSGAAAPRSPRKILILGGTNLIGPHLVEAARAHGHTVTLFNRGKTNPGLFPDLEKLHGDRDPKKGEGLKALAGRKWDAVIDDSGYFPRMVQASAELLAPNVKHYLYVSSISAYASDKEPDQTEDSPVAKLADPAVETMGKNGENYGGLKALCEQAVQKAMPGRFTVVRPGYIVGPGDNSDRFTYWPVRFDRGGEMLAPGSPSDPIQIIDVRDLADWLLLLVERSTTGVFNATGPEQPWSMGGLLDACRAATGKDTKLTWVPSEFLVKNGEDGDGSIPIWAPPIGKTAGFHRRNIQKAVKAGLRFRSPVATIKDTLAWFKGLPEERRHLMHAGVSQQREQELLALWAKEQGARSGAAKP